MMGTWTQDLVVGAVVVAAVAWLLRRAWTRRRRAACAGCDGCPAGAGAPRPAATGAFVPLGSVVSSLDSAGIRTPNAARPPDRRQA